MGGGESSNSWSKGIANYESVKLQTKSILGASPIVSILNFSLNYYSESYLHKNHFLYCKLQQVKMDLSPVLLLGGLIQKCLGRLLLK
jgi:hypothetical protein